MKNDLICRVQVLINQVGYPARGGKKFVVEANIPLPLVFTLRDLGASSVRNQVFNGALIEVEGDFGRYYVGDFSAFTAPGQYVIAVGSGLPTEYFSHVFAISDTVYTDALEKGLGCFALQRCGPSTTGYNAPCHLDDGVRADTGAFLDVVGGWHDASDLLKWSGATIQGLVGLLHIAATTGDLRLKARLFEEARWGNLYFLKLQDAAGYLYSHGIGGDPPEQGNHWTDNVRGTADDRRIVTNPGGPCLQHLFIMAQADLVRVYREWDAQYAAACLQAAHRAFDWVSREPALSYVDFGTGAGAGISLFEATGDRQYLDYAARLADHFVALQERPTEGDGLAGYFHQDETHVAGVKHVHIEPFGMIGFCRFLEGARGHMDVIRWNEALRLYCDACLQRMAARNAFGITPCQVKIEEADRSGARTYAGSSYRYFITRRKDGWWVGNNAHLAGTGMLLCMAARILGEPEYAALAQRHLDWILGANPFAVSFMHGVGYANPPEYIYTGFQPRTPKIPGAIMCGIAGDAEDRPDLQAGSYHTCEIWTPMLIQTLCLMHERMRDHTPR